MGMKTALPGPEKTPGVGEYNIDRSNHGPAFSIRNRHMVPVATGTPGPGEYET